MGMFDFLKKKHSCNLQEPVETAMKIYEPAIKCEFSNHDKEEIMVKQVTREDMQQFTSLPFEWNSDIKTVTGSNTKPYAYMDIAGSNVDIAENELRNMNSELLCVQHLSPLIAHEVQIPTQEVLLSPRSSGSYSKIMCTPYTFTGRISKYPASLYFVTELHAVGIDTTHGELFYDRKGKVAKAKICFWRNRNGYFVYFQTLNGKLTVTKIESTVITDDRGLPGVVYKTRLH